MKLDGISLEILRSRLVAMVDEGASALMRTAYSSIVRDNKDFAVVLADCDGFAVAQSTQSIPVFLGTMSRTIQHFLAAHPPRSIRPGDVLITNDPWMGTGHLYDISMLVPVHAESGLVGFVGVVAHMSDIGGRRLSADSVDVYEEGLRLPITYLRRSGELNGELTAIIEANVRTPTEVMGDLMSMTSAAHVVTSSLLRLVNESGINDLRPINAALRERAKRAMLAALGDVPRGTFSKELRIEAGASDLVLTATISVGQNDTVTVDYAGSSDQISAGVNSTFSYTCAYTIYAFKCLLMPGIPFSEGIADAIDIRAPIGSIVNASHPAAVSARNVVGHLIPTLIFDALADCMPNAVVAECGAPRPYATIGGIRQDGRPFAVIIPVMGGFGARATKDGPSALAFPTNTETTSIEFLESRVPVIVEERELIPNSGGQGRYRGGLGQRLRMRCLNDEMRIATVARRTKWAPNGLFGGGPGAPTRVTLQSGDGAVSTPPSSFAMRRGDVLTIESPGGGGYGDPSLRASEAIEDDRAGGYDLPVEPD